MVTRQLVEFLFLFVKLLLIYELQFYQVFLKYPQYCCYQEQVFYCAYVDTFPKYHNLILQNFFYLYFFLSLHINLQNHNNLPGIMAHSERPASRKFQLRASRRSLPPGPRPAYAVPAGVPSRSRHHEVGTDPPTRTLRSAVSYPDLGRHSGTLAGPSPGRSSCSAGGRSPSPPGSQPMGQLLLKVESGLSSQVAATLAAPLDARVATYS